MNLKALENVLSQSEEAFQEIVLKNVDMDANYLKKMYWYGGKQYTVLTFLIKFHSAALNLAAHIHWILGQGADCYVGQPLHLCLETKPELAPLFFEYLEGLSQANSITGNFQSLEEENNGDECLEQQSTFDTKEVEAGNQSVNSNALNALDKNRKTLLAHAIAIQDPALCQSCVTGLIRLGVNVNQATPLAFEGEEVEMSPLHQSIIQGKSAISLILCFNGADYYNPCGVRGETPLVLVARLGDIDLLRRVCRFIASEARSPHEGPTIYDNKLLQLDQASNIKEQYPIEVLCEQLRESSSHRQKNIITAIAVLFYYETPAPRNKNDRETLSKYRKPLMEAIKSEWGNIEGHVKDFPGYAQAIIDLGLRILNRNDVLYSIMYHQLPKTGLTSIDRNEYMLTTMQTLWLAALKVLSPIEGDEDLRLLRSKQEKFARFVINYFEAKNACSFSRGKMAGKLARGEVTQWEEVLNFVREYPNSRSQEMVSLVEKNGLTLPEEKSSPRFFAQSEGVRSQGGQSMHESIAQSMAFNKS